jgi:endonuclease YncB( thermonuclease family)
VTLAIAALLGLLASFTGSGEDEETPTPTLALATTPPERTALPSADATPEPPLIQGDPALLQSADVIDVIDGDTIDVRIDGREERVRYYGVDTPERGDDCYGDATDRNEELAGARVLLQPDARDRDSFGRLLRYVFLPTGESVEGLLIAEGLGYAWRDDGAFRDVLVVAEEEAAAAGAGCLWE